MYGQAYRDTRFLWISTPFPLLHYLIVAACTLSGEVSYYNVDGSVNIFRVNKGYLCYEGFIHSNTVLV